MQHSKVQIIATIGPSSRHKDVIRKMADHQMDVVRLNFSWGTHDDHLKTINFAREVSKEIDRNILIIEDLSGPRIQEKKGHEFNNKTTDIITEKDINDLKFGIEKEVDYVAMSYVGYAEDISKLRKYMMDFGKIIPIIAKIERKIAVKNLDEIIKVADAVMVARGDLGNEVPLEEIPFIEKDIIDRCKKAGKTVIVATQMMLSMTEHKSPTRAEVTDVAYAVTSGADAVMLSEETASGKYPIEAVEMMERINLESEEHFKNIKINPL